MVFDNGKTRRMWDDRSDDYYERFDSRDTIDRIENDPAVAFPGKVLSMLRTCIPDFKGRKVCVPGSGDNTAVFAFHLLGARVTSVDISLRQIENARRIASGRGWDIAFVCDDNMGFSKIENGSYDLIYTSNGVHVWISDLKAMYRNFHGALKDGGHYVLFETHPFIRPFDDKRETVAVRKPYDDTGPFGETPEYAWRIQDFVNSLADSGFAIRAMEEFHPDKGSLSNHNWWYRSCEEAEKDGNKKFDWRRNPWAALPQWLAVRCQKRSEQ